MGSNRIDKDLDWLKARTIRVRGLSNNERGDGTLQYVLDKHLIHTTGKVLGIINVPDYKKLFKLENQKKNLEDIDRTIEFQHQKEPCCLKCVLSKRKRSKMITKMDEKIKHQIQKSTMASGHAFVCFDSMFALSKFLQVYRNSPASNIKLCW